MSDTKFKLGIVDEYQDDIDDFRLFFENDFDIVEIELSNDIEKIINNVFDSNVDSVAIDYKLTEHNSDIGFNGNEVYNILTDKYYKFPAFILTNYVPDASNSNIKDEFNIIPKRWMKPGTEEGNELIVKIKNSIIKYKQYIEDIENELITLNEKKQNNNITAKEEERLVELDTILEKIISKEDVIPKKIKEQKSELSKLIDLAEEILKKEKKD